jgi:SAM-dependent methyltransferase
VRAFKCPICSSTDYYQKRFIKSEVNDVAEGLTRPREVCVDICACGNCDVEFNGKLIQGADFKMLYAKESTYSSAEYTYENGIWPIYTIDTLDLVETFKRPPGQLLEVGFLDVRHLERLAGRGWCVEGVELDSEAVKKARERGFKVVWGDVQDGQFDGRKFDVVMAIGVLEHIEHPEKVLRKVYELLHPNGLILLQLPNPGSLNAVVSRISHHGWDMYCEPGHIYHFRKHHLDKLFSSTGFITIHYGTATIRVRGKIPVLPVRIASVERRVKRLVHASGFFLWLYTKMLRTLDRFRLSDTHVVIGQRI